jgi:hypothetical protein
MVDARCKVIDGSLFMHATWLRKKGEVNRE